MKKFLVGFILGAVVAIGAIWYYGDKNPHARGAREDLKNAASEAKDYVKEKVDSLNLTPDTITDEMAKTGQVVRKKVQDIGHAIADATADARITSAIKAKLVADPDLSALSISVSTTSGKVTLSGTVSSPENVAKAIRLAMSVDGVQEVVSTLTVKT